MPPAPITNTSFQGVLSPDDVARVLNLLVTGAPFGATLSRYPTSRSAVAFPTAAPDRPSWIPEMGEIPVTGLNDDADIVATCKLATIVLMSNESADDASVNLTTEFSTILSDTASAELDRGILYGAGTPEPAGVVAAAPAAAGADLGAAMTAAIGSIGDAGGTASHLCALPSVLAAGRDTRDQGGQLVYPGGIGAAYGLAEVGCPELQPADILVIDRTRAYLIVRNDFQVDASQDFAFQQDALAIRIRGRFAVAAPALAKALRKLDVADASASPPFRSK